jgi:hypothetical protein
MYAADIVCAESVKAIRAAVHDQFFVILTIICVFPRTI